MKTKKCPACDGTGSIDIDRICRKCEGSGEQVVLSNRDKKAINCQLSALAILADQQEPPHAE